MFFAFCAEPEASFARLLLRGAAGYTTKDRLNILASGPKSFAEGEGGAKENTTGEKC